MGNLSVLSLLCPLSEDSPVHLIEHEVVGPAEHDGAGRLGLGALEENQLAVADTLFRNLKNPHHNGGFVSISKKKKGPFLLTTNCFYAWLCRRCCRSYIMSS